MGQESFDTEFPKSLWSPKPSIGGFAIEESDKIYENDFQEILNKIKDMPDEYRTGFINKILPELGTVSHMLLNQIEIAEEEWEDNQKTAEFILSCEESLKGLKRFHEEVLKLY